MKIPVFCAKILIPKTDLNKWAVVACDQHTSNLKYWQELKSYVGDEKSSLNLILPEVYLHTDTSAMVESIFSSMDDYVAKNVFKEVEGVVCVERTLNTKKVRRGLVAAVDLEQYSYINEDKALIRASEGTVIERIPPRVKIREKCSLELTHIMLLVDDPEERLQKAIDSSAASPLYDFELNMNGGHLKGGLIKDISRIENALENIYEASKKNLSSPMLFAVGDGNHSLATAKKVYENQKAQGGDCSLARYALVEIVNIYDSGLDFEPIHRIVFSADNAKLLDAFRRAFIKDGEEYVFFDRGDKKTVTLPSNPIEAVKVCDSIIAQFFKDNEGEVDYIHGEDELKSLSKEKQGAGIVLKSMKKSDLFPYVAQYGALPKKTFSMGEAEDKRYYLEARRIK